MISIFWMLFNNKILFIKNQPSLFVFIYFFIIIIKLVN